METNGKRREQPRYTEAPVREKVWYQDWCEQWGRAAYRVAKPSAYLLAFGGTRTVHRMTVALEDAGWIIRDMLVWGYASGFPKSKASLKPAWEPIVMARKPGPLRELNIDYCRVPTNEVFVPFDDEERTGTPRYLGRWPANVLLTEPIFDGGWEGVVGGGETTSGKMMPTEVVGKRTVFGQDALKGYTTIETYGDSGTYSRFFLVPKADRADREPLTPGTYPGPLPKLPAELGGPSPQRFNTHPTVKPTELMRHLVRLVTPTGGVVLDPFLGSGTTALAAEMEGFAWIGIEREAEYVAIAEARLNGTQRGLGLDVPAPTPAHQPRPRETEGRDLSSNRRPDLIWASYQDEETA
jgi:site-specific DNA-methyltransferase (adenine-specific)